MNKAFFVVTIALFIAPNVAAAQSTSLDPVELFETADKNGDGAVSRDEFIAARTARFDTLDANHDGTLTNGEFSAAAKGLKGRVMAPLMFAQFDANSDGHITRQEFASAPTPGFDSADANRDGVVSQVEMKAAM